LAVRVFPNCDVNRTCTVCTDPPIQNLALRWAGREHSWGVQPSHPAGNSNTGCCKTPVSRAPHEVCLRRRPGFYFRRLDAIHCTISSMQATRRPSASRATGKDASAGCHGQPYQKPMISPRVSEMHVDQNPSKEVGTDFHKGSFCRMPIAPSCKLTDVAEEVRWYMIPCAGTRHVPAFLIKLAN